MLSGSFKDLEGRLDPGDVEWITSGRGSFTVTTRSLRTAGRSSSGSPCPKTSAGPTAGSARAGDMPVKRAGADARIYSGGSGDAVARTANAAGDAHRPSASAERVLRAGTPVQVNGFIAAIEGVIGAEKAQKAMAKDQWVIGPAAAEDGSACACAPPTAAAS